LNDANRPRETHQTTPQLDVPAQQLLDEWLAQLPPKSCDFHAHVAGAQAGPLTRLSASVRITLRDRSAEATSAAEYHYYSEQPKRKVPAQHYVVTPRWHPCPACELAKIAVPPIHLRSAFDRFVIREPVLAGHLAKCREFAGEPQGFLLLLGSVGGGKTFLAVAIARALLRRLNTLFISHAELLRRHRLTYLRPAQGEDRPKDIIAACQSAGLLILDDLGRRREGRDEDAVLHEVLSYRYEHLRPTILTGNLDKPALHELLGDALYDRIQEACFARIEFGLPSYRADLNAPYLAAAKSRQERP
jgi:chromosomal replication initiation ATPase DnaA